VALGCLRAADRNTHHDFIRFSLGSAVVVGRIRCRLFSFGVGDHVVKSTFVLIHGAWHGGWCWQRVAETLSGVGERSHLAGLRINLKLEPQSRQVTFIIA
jgi:hypothetical protein